MMSNEDGGGGRGQGRQGDKGGQWVDGNIDKECDGDKDKRGWRGREDWQGR